MGDQPALSPSRGRLAKTALRVAWIALCLLLAIGARVWNYRDVFVEGRIHFVDADCYSRMTRARIVAENPGTMIRRHDFENWPSGITPHTTAPLDYLIVGLKGVLDLGFRTFDQGRTSLLRSQSLDLAGALIGPLLGFCGTLFFAWWLWKYRVRFGELALLFYAISPILAHGTILGRPDHQALLILLLTVAGCSELILARPVIAGEAALNRRAWGFVDGAAWALSLWVSLYEPFILLLVVFAVWMIANRQTLWARDRWPGVASGLIVMLIVFGIKGWRMVVPTGEMGTYFWNWQHSIGELSRLDLFAPLLFGWLGWGILITPFLLIFAGRKDPRSFALLAFVLVTLALTVWQLRWGYFLALAFALAVPWQLQALRRPALVWTFFLAMLWPMFRDWDTRLFPDSAAQTRSAMARAELAALHDLATTTVGNHAGAFIAPWWLSPAIAYWSGNPCVAGSSHESLPGILDAARFYLSTTTEEAAAILRKRPVRWVLADEPSRVLNTSASLLAVKPSADALAVNLMKNPEALPAFLQERKPPIAPRADGLFFYRLYEVVPQPAGLPAPPANDPLPGPVEPGSVPP